MNVLIDLDEAMGFDLFNESQDLLIKRVSSLCSEYKMEHIIVSTSVFNYISNNKSFMPDSSVFLSSSKVDLFGNELQSLGTIYGIPVFIDIEFARDRILLTMSDDLIRDRTIDKIIEDIDFVKSININLKGTLF